MPHAGALLPPARCRVLCVDPMHGLCIACVDPGPRFDLEGAANLIANPLHERRRPETSPSSRLCSHASPAPSPARRCSLTPSFLCGTLLAKSLTAPPPCFAPARAGRRAAARLPRLALTAFSPTPAPGPAPPFRPHLPTALGQAQLGELPTPMLPLGQLDLARCSFFPACDFINYPVIYLFYRKTPHVHALITPQPCIQIKQTIYEKCSEFCLVS